MRQGQQNRRGRGRNNGGSGSSSNNQNNQHRKGQNPLTRSFESTGPDMKIRGTPAHIAEKYVALARDAQSFGDPVLAENYLQHAEHYNRIIFAYREQQTLNGGEHQNGQPIRGQSGMSDFPGGDDFGDDDGAGFGSEQPSQPPVHRQPEQQQRPYEGNRFEDRPQRNRQDFQRPHRDRNDQGGRGNFDRPDRPDRPERPDRPDRPDRPERRERVVTAEQPVIDNAPPPPQEAQPRRRERFVPQHEQPEFLRRPVRRPRREGASEDQAGETGDAAPATVDDSGRD